MTKVYIAGFFDTRARLRPYRDALVDMGYTITATWLDEEGVTYESTQADYHLACAVRDLQEVKACDMIIVDTLDVTPRGGREVEFGISLTKSIPRYIVGPVRNVFHQMATKRFSTWEDALEYFARGPEI